MPMILEKFDLSPFLFIRDVRPFMMRMADALNNGQTAAVILGTIAAGLFATPQLAVFADLFVLMGALYVWWLAKQPFKLPFKMPAHAGLPDPNNPPPGGKGDGKSEGILFVGNDRERGGKELWFTNVDARTHLLFLGTTGSGKTEGLKSLVSNSLMWGSGFVYVDGKADTDLWASLYSLTRRFGRDDDILVLNYMTGNTDVFDDFSSNSFNPFAFGSASFLANLLVGLMPEAGGDNAMWKERAVSLIFSLMPALTWKRDREGLLLDVGVVREYLELKHIVRLSRDQNMPERIIRSLQMYLFTLPGYVDDAFDDDGNERPPSPDTPMYDMQVARQQHGYLSMQFTRSLQSLADEYGYIFKKQLADVDVLDVVLNRRILVVLIPALEKSGDEAANLGKIVASSLKGMMGATLGANIEGSIEATIENKMTRAPSPYMTVFDEVGYYTAPGMAVMAAQARSLGFSLIFAAQDLPAMEKRVKQEARSIAGNCNIKIFGKLEDPLDTKDFWDKLIGSTYVFESKGSKMSPGSLTQSYFDEHVAGLQTRPRAAFDHLKRQKEGQVHIHFAYTIAVAQLFHADIKSVKALRVHKLLPVPETLPAVDARERAIAEVGEKLKDPAFALSAAGAPEANADVAAMGFAYDAAQAQGKGGVAAGAVAVASLSEQAVMAAAGGNSKQTEMLSWTPEPPPHMLARQQGGHPFAKSDEVFEYQPSAMPTPPPVPASGAGGGGAGVSARAGAAMGEMRTSRMLAPQEAEQAPQSEGVVTGTLTLPAEIKAKLQGTAGLLRSLSGGAAGSGNAGSGHPANGGVAGSAEE